MIKLKENEGIPRNILLMMSIVSGLTVANLYYNQPLLEEMRAFSGKLTVIVQAAKQPGTVTLEVTGKGLQKGTATILVE